jgi:hypothetical protein
MARIFIIFNSLRMVNKCCGGYCEKRLLAVKDRLIEELLRTISWEDQQSYFSAQEML